MHKRSIIFFCVILAIPLFLGIYLRGCPSREKVFLKACRTGNVFMVKKMIKSGKVDINNIYPYAPMPLALASMSGQTETVKFLIENGANLNIPGNRISLNCAAASGYNDIVNILLEHGVEINNKSRRNGYSPLIEACAFGKEETVEILLKHKAKVNITDNNGETALDHAFKEQTIKLLKSYGAKTGADLKMDRQAKEESPAEKGRSDNREGGDPVQASRN
jgi:ankyrin repeat protein